MDALPAFLMENEQCIEEDNAGLMERKLFSSVQEVMDYLHLNHEPDLSEAHIKDILDRKK